MEKVINDLVKRYDSGVLSRRELVGALALLSVAGGSTATLGAPAGFESASLNHVSIMCSDLQRTIAFYQRTFGLSLMTQTPQVVQLAVGKTQHLSIRSGNGKTGVDHFAIGIDRFNMDQVAADLRARGAAPETSGGAGLHVNDPDGLAVQVIANPAA